MGYGCKCQCENFREHIQDVSVSRRIFQKSDARPKTISQDRHSRTQIDRRGNLLTDRSDGSNDVTIRNLNPARELCDD